MESPLTPTLSPLTKGGEGREWGDSACEKPHPCTPNKRGWCTLISATRGLPLNQCVDLLRQMEIPLGQPPFGVGAEA